MQFTVEVTQGKHKHRGGLIAGKADDHAVRGAPSFDLDPLAPPGPVASICALCHDAFEARNFAQPLTRLIRVRRVQDQLQAWMQVVEHVLQAMAPLDEWQLHEVCAGTLEHVEDQQNRRALRRGFANCAANRFLAVAEEHRSLASILIGDHDLAVDDRRLRQAFAGLGQFREPVSKVLALTARQSDQAVA